MLNRRHPAYECNLHHWRFLEATYTGGRAWFAKNIFRYHKEGHKEFKDRTERAYRFNHTREVVDLVNKYVFKGEFERNTTDAPEFVTTFWKTATFSKRPIEEFMEAASRRASIFGRVWIVADTNATEDVKTEADRKAAGARVYVYTVKPENVLDFAFDDDGELNWFIVRETIRDDENPLKSSGETQIQFRVWTKNYWVLFTETTDASDKTKKIAFKDFREHNLGMVPAFPHDNSFSDDREAAPALINDAAYLDRAVANYLSNLDAIIQDQTFSQLAIPAQSMMPDDDDYKSLLAMGTKRIFAYNAEGGAAPVFISPDPRQAQLIMAVITKIVGEIYHSVGMAGERTKEDNAAGIDNSSGVAKAYDFERLNALLVSKSRSLELAERNLLRIVYAYNSQQMELQDVPELVSYPSNFDVRSLSDEFDTAKKLLDLDGPTLLRKTQMQKVVDKLFPRLEKDLREKLRKEIDNEWPFEPAEQSTDTVGEEGVNDDTPPALPPVPGKENRQGENNKP